MAKNRNFRAYIPRLVTAVVLLGMAGALYAGWKWISEIRCERIEITGETHANERELLKLARVDTGMVLFELEPVLIEDRVVRHPWVSDAEVMRLPNGTLRLKVRERTPVLLVIDRQGNPAFYLDDMGYAMPVVRGAIYNVPLLRGYDRPFNPVRPVEVSWLRELLTALGSLDETTDAIISDFEIRAPGEIWLHTSSVAPHGSILIRVGRYAFEEKFQKLGAFWRQAILLQGEKSFQLIDLRFDSQVVTQEEVNTGRPLPDQSSLSE